MATLEEQVQGERMARIVLSMIAEPDDPITGYILARYGGVAALGLAESDRDVTGLPRADVLLWRERLRARIAPDLLDRAVGAQQQGFDTLIPADATSPMAQQIPGASLVVIEGAGHLSNLEAPAKFNEALAEFMSKVGIALK